MLFRSGLTERGEQAAEVLRSAAAKGLHAEDYSVPNNAVPPAQAELTLTRSLMQIAHDLRWGRRNHGLYEQKPGPDSDLLRQLVADPDGIAAGLSKLEPRFAEYKRLEAALPRYQLSGTADQVNEIELTLERWRDRKSTRLNSSHIPLSRMPSSA